MRVLASGIVRELRSADLVFSVHRWDVGLPKKPQQDDSVEGRKTLVAGML